MKTALCLISILVSISCFHVSAALAEPIPDIKANGSDGRVSVSTAKPLSITVALQALDWLGISSDWWCVAQTAFSEPENWYHYNAIDDSWSQGFLVSFQGPLWDLSSPLEVLNIYGLPAGEYVFYFGVDNNMNAAWDGYKYYDSVEVDLYNPLVPSCLINIGDSIGEGSAALGDIGVIHHEMVWSTGYDPTDTVYTLNEHFEDEDPTNFYENNAAQDGLFNHAVEGAQMADFVAQANEVIAAAGAIASGRVGMITVFLGNNDVCTNEVGSMTEPVLFEAQYRAGLDILASSDATKEAYIHVSGIPDIYWLWIAKRSSAWCRVFVWPFVPCRELLENSENDCGSDGSELDPDNIYHDDGENCIRRKEFHAAIRDVYNRILRDVLEEYRTNGSLPNAYYIDIFDIQFDARHINSGDCFHPSEEGQRTLAQEHWCRSFWSKHDPTCWP